MCKRQSPKSTNSLKMKDPLSSCSYQQLYQDVKRFSKSGEFFCKELMSVFHQRSELELTYSKGLQKLAGKLIRASKEMTNNSTFGAWSHVSDEMYSRADAHRSLGTAFQHEATVELRQVLDEHSKRKRPLDGAIERSAKAVTTNWADQLKLKKKLLGLSREHEALFNFVDSNKQTSTEKEKQKMLARLTRSAELQARVDDEYFQMNLNGHETRVKWENTLRTSYQILQEMERQRLEVLGDFLKRYTLHMSTCCQALKHGQRQIEQTVQRVDVEHDIETLLPDHRLPPDDNQEFLLLHYFEEESKSLMSAERRREALRARVRRLQDTITRTTKDLQGIRRLMKTYSENPSFSNERNLEETEQQLDEVSLKLELLEATHAKVSASLSEAEGTAKSRHRFSDSISSWKDKDSEHSVVQLRRPVKLCRSSYRSLRSLRASIVYKGPRASIVYKGPRASIVYKGPRASSVRPTQETQGDTAQAGLQHSHAPSLCRARYHYSPQQHDELGFREGEVLSVLAKADGGWWFGERGGGRRGHFPASYVVELSPETSPSDEKDQRNSLTPPTCERSL